MRYFRPIRILRICPVRTRQYAVFLPIDSRGIKSSTQSNRDAFSYCKIFSNVITPYLICPWFKITWMRCWIAPAAHGIWLWMPDFLFDLCLHNYWKKGTLRHLSKFQPICYASRLVGMIQAAFGKAVITLRVPLPSGWRIPQGCPLVLGSAWASFISPQ